MKIRRILAAAATLTGLIAGIAGPAAPASATVYNQNCYPNYPGVRVKSDNHPDFCYAWDRGSDDVGWANIDNATWVCSGVNDGYVQDIHGDRVAFEAGRPCQWLNHKWIRYIVITN